METEIMEYITKKKENMLYKKYQNAIIELNYEEDLETYFYRHEYMNTYDNIRELCRYKSELCYFNNGNKNELKIILIEKIIKMPENIKNKFSKYYGDIIDDILNYCYNFVKMDINISTDLRKKIDEAYWNLDW